jgi:phage gp29-like protein
MGVRQWFKDRFGRDEDARPAKPDDRVYGAEAIRNDLSAHVSAGLTPQKLAAIFKEADEGNVVRQAELFEEMEEKDTHLSSILGTRKQAVLSEGWTLDAASQDPKDVKIAEQVGEWLGQCENMGEILSDLLDAIAKGFSVVELHWTIQDNKALVRRGEWLHQKYFQFNQDRHLLLTDPEGKGQQLVPAKFAIHRYQAKSGHPARGGLSRVCGWSYLFKNYSLKDWVVFAEVFGMPLRLGKYDPAASKEDKEALKVAVQMLGSDAAGVISKSTEIDFVQHKGTGGADIYQKLHDTMCREQSKAILGQTLTTDTSGATGTYSAAKVHNQVRQDLQRADAAALADTVRRDILMPLVGFNLGWDQVDRTPRFVVLLDEDENLEAEAKILGRLVKEVGVRAPQTWVHERFRIPQPKDGEAVYGPAAQGAVAMSRQLFAAAGSSDLLRSCEEMNLASATPEAVAIMESAVRLIEQSTSYEEAFQALATMYANTKPELIEEYLGRAELAAQCYGRWRVHSGD